MYDYKALRTFYKDHGICYRCGIRNAENGRYTCLLCMDKERERNRRYRETHPLTEAQRKHNRIMVNSRRDTLKAQGICVDCGKHPAANGRIRCTECLIKDRERHIKKDRERGVIPWELRGNGYCWLCCKPIPDGVKQCEDCRKKSTAGLAIARSNIDMKNHIWRKIAYTEVMEKRCKQ